ncbi:DUF1826 domain-containing protein [Oricola sp.]|uniref:DUF1826 domain-containing protein n=1 Tax=Oricola sp. TaxID=1979950 RepID=UPI003BADB96B
MIAQPALAPETGACLHLADSPAEFDAIHREDVAAVIWQRRPLESFQRWIDDLDPALLPTTRLILRPGDVPDTLKLVCDLAGTPDCADRRRLIEDAAALSKMFAQVMHTEFLRLRLDVISTDACRKFHVDAVTARLVCAYRGKGTQYGVSYNGSHPDLVNTVPTGMPMIMRGARWHASGALDFVHRSPPIEGTGATRLLLVLDPVDDPGDEI